MLSCHGSHDCDDYIEKEARVRKQHIHVYVKEEEWEVIYRFVIDGKESVLAIILHGHFLEIEVSRFSRPEASFPFFVFHQVRLEIGG